MQPKFESFKNLEEKKFETLSWQIEAGHHISFAVFEHLKKSMQITEAHFDELVRKRVAYLKAKKEEARTSGDLRSLALFSSELEEFPQ